MTLFGTLALFSETGIAHSGASQGVAKTWAQWYARTGLSDALRAGR
jgi:hypothetical protein